MSNFRSVNSLYELQNIEFYILKQLNDFCTTNDLRVYLTDGTLLGAVREKGFIPWDDDIDVCMSRTDYNKLKDISKGLIGKDCLLIDPESSDYFNGYIPLVVYNNSKVYSKQFRTNEELKISISIFVYDGVPQSKFKRWFFLKRIFILRAKHALCRANFKYAHNRMAKIVGPFLSHFFSTKNVLKYKNKILKLQQKYPFESYAFVANIVDSKPKPSVVEKQKFIDYSEVVFEQEKFKAFSYYDLFLTKFYGDYMVPPPANKRIPKHSYYGEIDEDFRFIGVLTK